MKITHINFSFTMGGIDTMLVDIINNQAITNSIELIIVNDYINYELLSNIDKNVKIHLIKRPPKSKNPIYFIRLNSIIWASKTDFIHCHSNNLSTIIFSRVKKGLTIHALDLPVQHLKKYDILFAISESVRNDIKKRSNIDSIVLYNGINFSELHKRKNHTNNKNFKIVQISRLDHKTKGQHILLRALAILIQDYNIQDISLDFIGEGSSYPYLCNLRNELNLCDYVNFLGNQNRAIIYQNLPHYDLLVQPSLKEGFGLTILEGVGSCIPVLASNSNGTAEISKTLEFDFLFETGNPQKLAEAILNIHKNHKDVNQLDVLEMLSIKAKNLFSIEQTASNYIYEYKKINKN